MLTAVQLVSHFFWPWHVCKCVCGFCRLTERIIKIGTYFRAHIVVVNCCSRRARCDFHFFTHTHPYARTHAMENSGNNLVLLFFFVHFAFPFCFLLHSHFIERTQLHAWTFSWILMHKLWQSQCVDCQLASEREIIAAKPAKRIKAPTVEYPAFDKLLNIFIYILYLFLFFSWISIEPMYIYI